MRRIAAVLALVAVSAAAIADHDRGRALGPVVAITPFEVDAGGGFVGWIGDVDVAGRGQTAAVRDDEVSEVAFVHLDDGDPEPLIDGIGIGVSGDGCTAVSVEEREGPEVARVVDRCAARDITVALPFNIYESTVNVTFDGRFAAIHYAGFVSSASFNGVLRLDTTSGALTSLPAPSGLPQVADPELHSDISDDGQFVVAPVSDFQRTAVALWDVAAGTSTVLVSAPFGRWAGFPSISGDGQWIAFASNEPRGFGELGNGPWVYVRARTTGELRRVSPPAQPAYYTSFSRDATQVAYAVSNGVIPPPVITSTSTSSTTSTTSTSTTTNPPILVKSILPEGTSQVPACPDPAQQGVWRLAESCPTARIDVAYGPTPGLSAAQTETVSLDAAGAQTGTHWHPELSGNGRWVAWVSDAGNALLGQALDLDGLHHAYLRRRDPGLVVDDLAFAPIVAGATADAATTVRNTGRTSVWLDEIAPAPAAQFARIGGTCSVGLSLAPGATCTVAVRFSPGPAPGASNGTLRVGEAVAAFDPVAAVGALTGTATPPSTTTTTTTTSSTSTTTVPMVQPTTTAPRGTPTTRPAPPTTRPATVALSASPDPVEFGSVAVGFASEPATVTVRNTGTGGGVVQTSLGGAHPDDFWVRTNGCAATTLAAAGECTIEVLLIPTGGGARSATLTIRAGSATVEVDLRGTGTFQPRLVPMPSAITEHGVATVYGKGFPPGGTFTVTVVETGLALTATADATGLFRTHLNASGQLSLGTYTLHVDGVAFVFDDVEAPLLVELGSFRPQGEGGPAFGTARLIVARGG